MTVTLGAQHDVCSDHDDENFETGSENLEAGSGQGRKAAAQAVIELTGRLVAAEEEAAALRQRLGETRSLTKVCSTQLS